MLLLIWSTQLRNGKEFSEFTMIAPVNWDLTVLARQAHDDHEQRHGAAERAPQEGEQPPSVEIALDLPGVAYEEDALANLSPPEEGGASHAPAHRSKGLRADAQAAGAVDEEDGYQTEPYERAQPNAKNARTHRVRRHRRQLGKAVQPQQDFLNSACKEPKAHTAEHAEHGRVLRTGFTPEQERTIPAGAGYTAKGLPEEGNDSTPRRLQDFEREGDVWELLEWDGR